MTPKPDIPAYNNQELFMYQDQLVWVYESSIVYDYMILVGYPGGDIIKPYWTKLIPATRKQRNNLK